MQNVLSLFNIVLTSALLILTFFNYQKTRNLEDQLEMSLKFQANIAAKMEAKSSKERLIRNRKRGKNSRKYRKSGRSNTEYAQENESSRHQTVLEKDFRLRSQKSIRVTLNKAEVDQNIKNLASLLRQGKTARAFDKKTGEVVGFKIVNLDENSFFRKCGLRENDIVLAVNRSRFTSPNKAMRVFNYITKNPDPLEVTIKRDGVVTDINYEFVR